MKFFTLTDNFKRAISIAERATGKSLQFPIVSYILCDAGKNRLKISATNLEQAIVVTVLGKTEKEGKLAIPARMLSQLANSVTEEKITLEVTGGTLRIKTETYDATLQGLDPGDFPIIPKVESQPIAEVQSSIFSKALASVLPAVSQSDMRPELQGVLFVFDSKNGLKLAATDSFRLAEKHVTPDDIQYKAEVLESRCIVPYRAVQEVARIASETEGIVRMAFDRNQMGFYWENTEYITRLLEGEFPKYEGLIPASFGTSAKVSRRRLIEMLYIAGLFVSKLNDVRITFEPSGNMTLTSQDSAKGAYEGKIAGRIEGNKLSTAFNWQFLVDGLEHIEGDEVLWGLNQENTPAVMRQELDLSYLYLVMPIRL